MILLGLAEKINPENPGQYLYFIAAEILALDAPALAFLAYVVRLLLAQ
jgi:hypothetical protein